MKAAKKVRGEVERRQGKARKEMEGGHLHRLRAEGRTPLNETSHFIYNWIFSLMRSLGCRTQRHFALRTCSVLPETLDNGKDHLLVD